MSSKLNELMKKNPNTVQVYFKHYPLDIECNKNRTKQLHAGACNLSYASYCAYKQNRFWDMHDLIFANQSKFEETVSSNETIKLSTQIGLNIDVFKACMDDPETKIAIQKDIDEAYKLKVRGTPTIFINGKIFQSRWPEFFIEQLLNREIYSVLSASMHKP